MPSHYFGKINLNYNPETESRPPCGIVEVYPIVAATVDDAAGILQTILTARMTLCASDVEAVYAEVSDSDIRGDSKVLSGLPVSGSFGTSAAKTYLPYVSHLYRMVDITSVKRALRHIRLIPSVKFNADGVLVADAVWDPAEAAFFTVIKNNVAIATKDKTAIVPPFYDFAQTLAVTPERQSKKKVGRPFGLEVGRRVIR